MRVGICSVGTEVVVGDLADTNATWVAQRLREIDADVIAHLALPDTHERLVDGLRWLVERCDAIVTGGGLGPTPDDLTRRAVAEVAQVPLERRDDLVEALEARFAAYRTRMTANNLQQADVPAGARVFAAVGSAPGFAVDAPRPGGGTCVVYCLPGVPFELKAMLERDVLPDLLRRGGGGATVTRIVHVTGMGESSVAAALDEVQGTADADAQLELAFLASSDEVKVKIVGHGATPDDARERTRPVLDRALELLGASVAGVDAERQEDAIARLLRATGTTVATAESCTAGLVSARLSSVPGASDWLRGGLVAYSTHAKRDVLGVPGEVLEAHGPVSTATTEAMARRAREVFGADFGLAVACVAGPATQGGRAVGTTVTALATPDGGVRSREREVPGDRATITQRAASIVLEMLRQHLLEIGAAD